QFQLLSVVKPWLLPLPCSTWKAANSTASTFEDVLAEAQALGYAEADPTFDVEGIDAAHKLTFDAAEPPRQQILLARPV
ncbi:hypothetical protein Q6296_29040, partial [Klebsiella variicola]|uniref:hypothetical protein n=1 Tax=Klebsiella variicola TaxID=244366 RepID=UPI00272F86E3